MSIVLLVIIIVKCEHWDEKFKNRESNLVERCNTIDRMVLNCCQMCPERQESISVVPKEPLSQAKGRTSSKVWKCFIQNSKNSALRFTRVK